MSEKTIYAALIEFGMSPVGACAMLGNMMAESSLKANIAQRGMTNLTDEAYTDRFDKYPDACYRDGVGYGLCQWTFWSRKQGLWELAFSRGVSVGDEELQVEYAVNELKADYPGLWQHLCNITDLYTATERICKEFERPAVNNIATRYNFALDFYERIAMPQPISKPSFPPDPSIAILQAVLAYNGYSAEITGYKDNGFLATMQEFLNDISKQ